MKCSHVHDDACSLDFLTESAEAANDEAVVRKQDFGRPEFNQSSCSDWNYSDFPLPLRCPDLFVSWTRRRPVVRQPGSQFSLCNFGGFTVTSLLCYSSEIQLLLNPCGIGLSAMPVQVRHRQVRLRSWRPSQRVPRAS